MSFVDQNHKVSAHRRVALMPQRGITSKQAQAVGQEFKVSTRLVRRLAGDVLRVNADERAYVRGRQRGRQRGMAVKVAGLMCIPKGTLSTIYCTRTKHG